MQKVDIRFFVKCYNLDMNDKLTHIDNSGNARMVDVSDKPNSNRLAVARGEVVMRPETVKLIRDKLLRKGMF